MATKPNITISITGDNRDFSKTLDSTTVELEGFGAKASAKASAIGSAIGTGLALYGPQLISAGKDLISTAKELDILSKKVDTVFGDQAADVRKWADEVNESMGLSDEKVAGLTANLGDLLVPLGFTRKEAAKMSKETVGLSGALSAWSGGTKSAADVTEVLQKAMLGERDGLKALGISISEADVSARLLAKGQSNLTGEALAQAKATATLELIMEKSTDAQKAWTDGTMDNVRAQNANQAAVEDAQVAIGQGLLAAYTAVQNFIAGDLIPAVRRISEFISEHREYVIAAGIGIAATLVPAFIAWAASAIAATAATIAAAAPVIAIGAAIAALAAGIIYAYQHWDWFRTAVDTVADGIKLLWDGITTFAGWLSNDFVEKLKTVGRVILAVLTGGLSEAVIYLSAHAGDIWNALSSIPGQIKDGFVSVYHYMIDPVYNAVRWFADEVAIIGSVFGRIGDAIAAPFKAAFNSIARLWNSTVGSLSFSVPGWVPGIGGKGWNVPDIPVLHSGGIFDSGRGEGLALLKDGEGVFTASQMAALGGRAVPMTIINNFPAAVDPRSVEQAQLRWNRRNGR